MDESDEETRPLLPRRVRGVLLGVFALLCLVGIFLPNVAIVGHPPAHRWLFGTSAYFLHVTSNKVPGSDPGTVGLGFTLVFLGLGMWELGLLITLLSAWVLASADINKWLWGFLLIGTILLAFGPSTAVLGKLALDASGAPTSLGWAIWPAFVAALSLLIWTLRSRKLIDRSWYEARPELIT